MLVQTSSQHKAALMKMFQLTNCERSVCAMSVCSEFIVCGDMRNACTYVGQHMTGNSHVHLIGFQRFDHRGVVHSS